MGSEGVISSPFYPRNYGNGQRCDWLIKVSRGMQVKLHFTFFHLEFDSGCRKDFVKLRNGPTLNFPLLGTYCGEMHLPVVHADSGSIYISFQSDGSNVFKGFQAKFTAVPKIQGSIIIPYILRQRLFNAVYIRALYTQYETEFIHCRKKSLRKQQLF